MDGVDLAARLLQPAGDLHGQHHAEAAVPVQHDLPLDAVEDLPGAVLGDLLDRHRLLAELVAGDGDRVQRPLGGQRVGERLVDQRAAAAVGRADDAGGGAALRREAVQQAARAPVRLGGGDQRGERAHGRVLEEVHHPDGAGQFGVGAAHPGDHLGGQQGVPAELEEVVQRADPGGFEQVRPHRGDELLDLAGRRLPGGGGRGLLGLGQRRAVDLAVGQQREPVEDDEAGRDHVVRQHVQQGRAQLGGGRRGTRARVLQVGDQVLPQALAPGQHDGLGDAGQLGQRGLDLARLDAVAAHLDLVVAPAEVVEAASPSLRPGGPPSTPAREVAGAVHPGPGPGVRVGQEAVGGQPGAAEVAACQAVAADVQLAGDTGRYGPQVRVQHVAAGAGQRAADRGAAGTGALGQHLVDGDADGGLGRAVVVEHRAAAVPGELRRPAGRAGLAAEHQGPAGQQPLHGHVGGERGEVGRGHLEVVDGALFEVLGQLDAGDPAGQQVDPPAGGQRQVQHGDAEVEGQ